MSEASTPKGGGSGDAPAVADAGDSTDGVLAERGTAPDHQPAQKPESSKKHPAPKRPDWKPLGAVRDYFNEQIKQDQSRW